MNKEDRPDLLFRLLGAVGGFFCGALSGTVVLIAVITITRSTFGLSNVWPGALVGALIGLFLGFFFPRLLKIVITIFAYFP